MAAHWFWWILAALLVGAELLTGTFYLLAVGIAFAVGGLVALLGASPEIQLGAAAVVAVAGVFVSHRWRGGRAVPTEPPSLDVGQSVKVQAWNPDGTARVAYRGSMWTAELAGPGMPRGDVMYIVGTRGSTLLIADRRPASA